MNIEEIPLELIAPCGMNCRLCMGYARDKKPCLGCWGDDASKAISCVKCRIKNCEGIAAGRIRFCYDCEKFPCARLKQLDKRYRTKYSMSMIDNLLFIQEHGLQRFIENEAERWACGTCGQIVCVHRPACPNCGTVWR